MPNIYPITKERYENKFIKKLSNFNFTSKFSLVQLVGAELAQALLNYPIAFIKQNNEFAPIALLSLVPQDNLFIDKNGRWISSYIPAVIRCYPFRLLKVKDDQLAVCVDEDSGLITEDKNDIPFFDENGKLSKEIESTKNFLLEFEKSRLITAKACSVLAGNELFEEWKLKIQFNDKEQILDGIYKINMMKLTNLDDNKFIEVKNNGGLDIAYAHFYSLGQMNTLKRLFELKYIRNQKAQQTDNNKVKVEGEEINLDWDKVFKTLK